MSNWRQNTDIDIDIVQRRYFQERPLKVWSHEQHASPGPKLLHPGERTTMICSHKNFWKLLLDLFSGDGSFGRAASPSNLCDCHRRPHLGKRKNSSWFSPSFHRWELFWQFLATNHYLGFYNESAQDSAGLDLAVLATCNYTILSRFAFKCVCVCVCKHVFVASDHCHFNPGRLHSIVFRGTFGLWGNILSGAPRLLPKHFLPSPPVNRPLDLRYQAGIMATMINDHDDDEV